MTGEIPQSDALSEANVDSLSELFSRDPETYAPEDIAKMVKAFRAQRERFALAEQSGQKMSKTTTPTVQKVKSNSAEELGF